jgi:hypothetical protein
MRHYEQLAATTIALIIRAQFISVSHWMFVFVVSCEYSVVSVCNHREMNSTEQYILVENYVHYKEEIY